jgi:hypothetical protein
MKKNRAKSNVLKDARIPVFKRNEKQNWYLETRRFARDGIVRPYVATTSSALR